MNEEKQKKIRTQLINFMNQELQNTKNKKSKFLINSMTLEQLEKKNMQCKDFFIEEKEQIYHNIDNGWIIGLNIYINNTSNYNPFIYSLSNIIKDNYIINHIKNKCDININHMDDIYTNKETIIQKQSNKILFIQKEGNGGSPVDTSLLIKKEVGERKLKRTNHEFNSNKMPINRSELFLNKKDNNNEKEIDAGKECNFNNNNLGNDFDDNNFLISKQLSKETLETEISRIIKICHDEKYTNSFDHFPSDSKISELSKEIKIAKMYAKKLKIYCRTLKRKNPINSDSIERKNKNYKNDINMKIFDEKNINKNINNEKDTALKKNKVVEEKTIKNKKYKKISSLLNLKKNLEKDNEDINQLENIKQRIPNKKIKSERNIKNIIKRSSFLKIIKDIGNEKNNNTISSTNKQFRTLEQKKSEKRKSLFNFKINKKIRKKTFEQDIKSKPKLKTKKDLIKTSVKIIRNKKTKENRKLNKNTKTSKDLYVMTESSKYLTNLIKRKKKKEKLDELLKNKILTETNKENNSKKLIKLKKKLEDYHKKKSSNINLHKNLHKKRGSAEPKINLSGFEKLNFLKAKHKSTKDQLLFINRKKITRRNRLQNNNTSVSQQRDSSPSIEKIKKFIKNNNRIKNSKKISNSEIQFKDKKKKTFGFLKTRRESIIEALKKMKKRKSTNYNEIKIFGGKTILSPICNEDKHPFNTIIEENKKNENKKIKIKFKKDIKEQNNEIYNDNKETDIFNIMDEFLYKKKQERGKKCI